MQRLDDHEHVSSENRECLRQHVQNIAFNDTRAAWCVWMRVLSLGADAPTAAPTAVGFSRMCPITTHTYLVH